MMGIYCDSCKEIFSDDRLRSAKYPVSCCFDGIRYAFCNYDCMFSWIRSKLFNGLERLDSIVRCANCGQYHKNDDKDLIEFGGLVFCDLTCKLLFKLDVNKNVGW